MQAAQHAQMIQQEAIAKVELRRRMRATAVPVIDSDVRAMLRQLGEPVTLFGEQQVNLGLSCCHQYDATHNFGGIIHACRSGSPIAGHVCDMLRHPYHVQEVAHSRQITSSPSSL